MKTYIVTIEGLKRVTIPVDADSEEEAKQLIEQKLKNEGTEHIPFDDMFDSIKVTNVTEQ